MSSLSEAGQRLIDAERTWSQILAYHENLPADREYDLGLRVALAWGSGDGHDEVVRRLQQHLTEIVRSEIAAMVVAAHNDVLRRESELKHVAEFHRRA
jgi:hypothetical protein